MCVDIDSFLVSEFHSFEIHKFYNIGPYITIGINFKLLLNIITVILILIIQTTEAEKLEPR
jgi:hypothetical protein